ncbi:MULTISPECIES: RNA polymerase sigma-70 factor [Niastella]|uniref:RNA polymerase sigma-70 factor n=1 Tax=Niastella soli TaxID=2821487 RepID=A0ABS3Z3M3_9BACT|nr:RNA polymerase sigma-70 factor [Niastella soli]MBO9204740.1 RNA polymerase sigma-70 factor [Niastella soli]
MDRNTTDSHLLELWRSGNDKAYRALFDRYFCKLYNYTGKLIPDKRVSEEIVMDVMLAIWQKRDQLKSDLSLSAYLYKSVRNRLIDHLRKQQVPTVSLELSTVEPSSSFITDSRILHKELETLYRMSLNRLPPQKKRIFAMSREEGSSYKEIADRLQLSKNTVENHMVAALRLLKRNMQVVGSY